MTWGKRVGKSLREWPAAWAAAGLLSLLFYFASSRPGPRLHSGDEDELRAARELLARGAAREAVGRLLAFAARRPSSPLAAEARLLLGEAYLHFARREPERAGAPLLDRAWEVLLAGRAVDPPRADDLRRATVEALLNLGETRRAVVRSAELLADSPGREALLLHVDALAADGARDPSRAAAHAREIERLLESRSAGIPSRAEGFRLRVQLYERLGSFEEMLGAAEAALREGPSPGFLLDRARALARLGRDAQARPAAEQALAAQADPRSRDRARLLLAQILQRTGDPAAENLVARLLREGDRALAPYAALVLAAHELDREAGRPLDRVSEALGAFHPAAAEEEGFDFGSFYASFARAAEGESRPETLRRYADLLGRFRQLYPRRSRYAFDRARLLLRADDPFAAAQEFAAASSSADAGDDERAEGWRGAARAFAAAGLHSRAAEYYRLVYDARRSPEDFYLYAESLMKASIYVATPDGPGALRAFAEYAQLVPAGDARLPRALLSRGRMLVEVGRPGEALQEFDRILRDYGLGIDPRAPEWREALLLRGRTLLGRGNSAEAREALAEYLERYGEAPEPLWLLARAAIAEGQWDEAAERLARLGRLEDPAHADVLREARFARGDVHFIRGEYAESARAFGEAYRRYGDRPERLRGLIGRARALLRLGRREEAIRDYEIARAVYGENREAFEAFPVKGYWSSSLDSLERELQ